MLVVSALVGQGFWWPMHGLGRAIRIILLRETPGLLQVRAFCFWAHSVAQHLPREYHAQWTFAAVVRCDAPLLIHPVASGAAVAAGTAPIISACPNDRLGNGSHVNATVNEVYVRLYIQRTVRISFGLT